MTYADFSALALGFLGDLTAYAERVASSREEAEDLLQATYEQAFASWESLDEPARCRAWLFRIARNLHIDRYRAVRARPELRLVQDEDSVVPEPDLPASAVERLEARDVEAALEQLPAAQREVVVLRDLWGFRYDEISAITDLAVGTVRSRLARARARLAELLVDEDRGRVEQGPKTNGRRSS